MSKDITGFFVNGESAINRGLDFPFCLFAFVPRCLFKLPFKLKSIRSSSTVNSPFETVGAGELNIVEVF